MENRHRERRHEEDAEQRGSESRGERTPGHVERFASGPVHRAQERIDQVQAAHAPAARVLRPSGWPA